MLSCQIDRTQPITVLQLVGDLRLGTVHQVRAALLKCLVECPEAVIVDLSQADVSSATALSVFGAVSRRAAEWPVVPLVLTAGPPEVRERLEPVTRLWQIPVYASLVEALSEAVRLPPPVRRERMELRPGTMAMPRARSMVAEACREWGLNDLVLPAELIMSELVSNAVQHAGTDLVASVVLRRGLLHLTVGDGDPTPPRKSAGYPPIGALSGRGLLLVDEFASGWGCLPIEGGKVVWAVVRLPA
ncbi:STAS domain-containing protein [Cryptosporangium arvum]|uniref:STAS domain-containing protein n=1 Tax=Cryptosporangium arvum TaxID=80871 RepID=UPI0004B26680|nr:STAS domain-containing protein [Cryptosporangium arvum]